mgnify:CR=1 FL=1
MSEQIEKYINLCSKEIFREKEALDYLHSRHITDDDIRKYKIGFSPCHWDITPTNPEENRFVLDFPASRNKLIDQIVFPILDYKGNLSGFATRTFKGEKRYNKFYLKPHMQHFHLWGLYENLKSIQSSGKVFIVESIFDSIAVLPWVPFVISPVAAKITPLQVNFLKRFRVKVYLGFNNDFNKSRNTGKKATEFALKLMKDCGIRAKSISLPSTINDFSDFRTECDDLGPFFDNSSLF